MMPEQNLIRIMLVDDHVLIRDGLRRTLSGEPDMQVVAEAGTAEEALRIFTGNDTFDIALIDYQLGNLQDGLSILKTLRSIRPAVRAMMLSGALPFEAMSEAVKLYNAGVFLKSEPLADLVNAIRRTMQGELSISSKAAYQMIEAADSLRHAADIRAPLTDLERSVLRFITEGLGNKDIASRLDTTESAVKSTLQRLFEKTGVRSRSQLVRYVFEFNLDIS